MKKLSALFKRYRDSGLWLATDIAKYLRLRLLILGAISLFVVLSRIVTFGAFLLYVRTVTAGEHFRVPIVGSLVGGDDLLLWSGIILGAATVMSASIFAEACYRIRLASAYGMNAAERVLKLIAAENAATGQTPYKQAIRLIGSDSWSVIRAALPLLSAILPSIQIAACLILLLILSWQITVILGVVALVYIVPYFFLTRRVVRASKLREEAAPQHAAELRRLVGTLSYGQYAAGRTTRLITEFLGSQSLRDKLGSFHVIRTNRSVVQAMNSLVLAFFLLGLVFYINAMPQDRALFDFIVYALIFMHAYNAANLLTASVAAFNRFQPQLARYADMLRPTQSEAASTASLPSKADPAPVFVRRDPDQPGRRTLKGSEKGPDFTAAARIERSGDKDKSTTGASAQELGPRKLRLSPGERHLVVQPHGLSPSAWLRWLDALGGRRFLRGNSFYLAPPDSILEDFSLREVAAPGLDKAAARKRVQSLLTVLGTAASETASVCEDMDRPWPSIQEDCSFATRFFLKHAPALSLRSRVIAVRESDWSRLSENERRSLEAALPEAVWLIDTKTPERALNLAFSHVVVASDKAIVAILDRETALVHPEFLTAGQADERALGFAGEVDAEDDMEE